jgi:hypothetical protein
VLLGAPFFVAGTLKVLYDILLYRSFQAVKVPEYEPQNSVKIDK